MCCFSHSKYLDPDPSWISSVVLNICAGILWQMDFPKRNLWVLKRKKEFIIYNYFFRNTWQYLLCVCVCVLCFRKFYSELSDLCLSTSIILFVFCQTALFRIAPILSLVFAVITFHQCMSSWIGVPDPNHNQVNEANNSSPENLSQSNWFWNKKKNKILINFINFLL